MILKINQSSGCQCFVVNFHNRNHHKERTAAAATLINSIWLQRYSKRGRRKGGKPSKIKNREVKMSNIAGKAYAMNVVTPIRFWTAWLNKVIFWAAGKRPSTLKGLITLSLIHYARWVVVDRDQFPHLSPKQPKENLRFGYMFFFQQLQRQLGAVCGLVYLCHSRRA